MFVARAGSRDAAEWGIERMRRSLGVDQDLRQFHDRFRFDPLIGRAVRSDPGLRAPGRPEPFEALAWAICEQLIEFERAAAIERRLTWRLGRRCPETGLRDSPSAAVLAGQAPALLASFDLSEGRASALVRAAREVASGRVDLDDPTTNAAGGACARSAASAAGPCRCWRSPARDGSTSSRRRPRIPQARRQLSTGDPRARATEEEVVERFAPYAPWSGLAGLYALRAQGKKLTPAR